MAEKRSHHKKSTIPPKKKRTPAETAKLQTGKQKLYPNLTRNPNWVKGMKSPNPSGSAQKFTTKLSQGIKNFLATVPPGEEDTYAMLISRGIGMRMYEGLKKGKKPKGFSSELVAFYREFLDRTEGKVVQPIALDKLRDYALSRSIADQDYFAEHNKWPEEA